MKINNPDVQAIGDDRDFQRFNITYWARQRLNEHELVEIPHFSDLESAFACGRYIQPQYLATGDYHPNGMVGAANLKDWSELFPIEENDFWDEQSSGWGGRSVVIDLRRLDRADPEVVEQVREVLQGLESYPLINDETHSELETEAQDEQWSDYGRSDCLAAIAKEVGISSDAWDDIPAEKVDAAFWVTCQQVGAYPEGGDDIRWPWSDHWKGSEFRETMHYHLQGRNQPQAA